jgi:hypothetical protein
MTDFLPAKKIFNSELNALTIAKGRMKIHKTSHVHMFSVLIVNEIIQNYLGNNLLLKISISKLFDDYC